LTEEFPQKSWIKRSVNKQLKKLRDTGTVDRRPGSGTPHSDCTEENVETVKRTSCRPTGLCVRNSSVNLFALYPFKYKLFKMLSLSLNTMLIVDIHYSDVCCDEFAVP